MELVEGDTRRKFTDAAGVNRERSMFDVEPDDDGARGARFSHRGGYKVRDI
jgi:hypothetical protein